MKGRIPTYTVLRINNHFFAWPDLPKCMRGPSWPVALGLLSLSPLTMSASPSCSALPSSMSFPHMARCLCSSTPLVHPGNCCTHWAFQKLWQVSASRWMLSWNQPPWEQISKSFCVPQLYCKNICRDFCDLYCIPIFVSVYFCSAAESLRAGNTCY